MLRPKSDPIDGLTDRAPLMDRDEEHKPVHGKVQALESFHKLKLHQNILDVVDSIFTNLSYPFPRQSGASDSPGIMRAVPHHIRIGYL